MPPRMPPLDPKHADQPVPEFFSAQVVEARRFYHHLSPVSEAALAVVCAGYEQCSAEYLIEREKFPYYSLEFVSHGSGAVWLDGLESRLHPGVAFTYGPGVPHRISVAPDNPLGKYFVDFVGKRSAALLHESGLKLGSVVNVSSLSDLQETFEALLRDGSSGAAHANALCAKLLEYLLEKIKASTRTNGKAHSLAEKNYERCRLYMQRHYARLMTIESVANECEIDKAYLCRLFKRFDSQTPYQYLIKQKMDRAATMLENAELLVSEVALSLGYADPFLFSRAFKSVFGIPPSEFRSLRG